MALTPEYYPERLLGIDRETEYFIADPQEQPVAENEYWNRDVFRLIAALTAQVTVDTSKYPNTSLTCVRIRTS